MPEKASPLLSARWMRRLGLALLLALSLGTAALLLAHLVVSLMLALALLLFAAGVTALWLPHEGKALLDTLGSQLETPRQDAGPAAPAGTARHSRSADAGACRPA